MHTVGTYRTVSADNTRKNTFCPPAARQNTVAYFRPNNGTTTVALSSSTNKYLKNLNLSIYKWENVPMFLYI